MYCRCTVHVQYVKCTCTCTLYMVDIGWLDVIKNWLSHAKHIQYELYITFFIHCNTFIEWKKKPNRKIHTAQLKRMWGHIIHTRVTYKHTHIKTVAVISKKIDSVIKKKL